MNLLTEEELLRDYRYQRMHLEEQEDILQRGEKSVNNLIEQTENEISRMLQEIKVDTSEASNFSHYRLNQITQEMNETFESEKRQVKTQLEQTEVEFKQQLRMLQEKD